MVERFRCEECGRIIEYYVSHQSHKSNKRFCDDCLRRRHNDLTRKNRIKNFV